MSLEIIVDEGPKEDVIDRMQEDRENKIMGYSGYDEHNDDVIYDEYD